MFKHCKECRKRKFNCHSWCEKYLTFREKQLKSYEQKKLKVNLGISNGALQTNDRRSERKWKKN